jgi:hypothetical protein
MCLCGCKLTNDSLSDGCCRCSLRGHDTHGQVWPDVVVWTGAGRSQREGGFVELREEHEGTTTELDEGLVMRQEMLNVHWSDRDESRWVAIGGNECYSVRHDEVAI